MSLKKVEIISNEFEDGSQLDELSSYIGKDVFSKSGEEIGSIKELVVHRDKIKGAIISSKKDFYIDKRQFVLNEHDVIILKFDPIFALIGKKVYDADGKELGNVLELKRSTNQNDFTSMIVSKNLLSKKLSIPKKEIETMGERIVLNKIYKNE